MLHYIILYCIYCICYIIISYVTSHLLSMVWQLETWPKVGTMTLDSLTRPVYPLGATMGDEPTKLTI